MDQRLYGYRYDPIGNRIASTANGSETDYLSNPLNQYVAVSNQQAAVSSPTYDLDGNMLTCSLPTGDWNFFWDAENRLVCASNATTVIRNTYDHQSRRIAKTTATETHTFLYDGWNPVAETIQVSGQQPQNYFYTWGLDLSGSPQGAGGVGGLLAVHSPHWNSGLYLRGETYYPAYDANGNVQVYLDVEGSTEAAFEYDAFGNTVAQSGAVADVFSFRFSTKYFDAETGLLMYQLRPLILALDCWLNRDPIEEEGGLNLYCFVKNAAVNRVDVLGLKECDCPPERVWMEIASLMKQAIDKTKSNPRLVDYNWDKKTSKAAYYLPVYREFGGYICCDRKRGRVSSTGPYPGTWRFKDAAGNELYSDDPSKLAKGGGVPTMGNITDAPLKQCGEGLTAVAFYHSHPEGPNLSPSDIRFSNENNLPIAGGAVGAKYFWLYNQSYGKILTEY